MVKAKYVAGKEFSCGSCSTLFKPTEKAEAAEVYICFACGAKNILPETKIWHDSCNSENCTRLQINVRNT